MVILSMEASRPLLWAAGTGFDPYYDDWNTLGIQFDIRGKEQGRLYEDLVQWIVANVPHDCMEVSREDANRLWDNLAR